MVYFDGLLFESKDVGPFAKLDIGIVMEPHDYSSYGDRKPDPR